VAWRDVRVGGAVTISAFPHWEHQGLAIIAFIAFVVLLVLTCRAARRGNARRYLFSGLPIVAAFLTIGLFEWALRSFDALPTADCGTAQEHQPFPECVKQAEDRQGQATLGLVVAVAIGGLASIPSFRRYRRELRVGMEER
jgi:hypothetical protein